MSEVCDLAITSSASKSARVGAGFLLLTGLSAIQIRVRQTQRQTWFARKCDYGRSMAAVRQDAVIATWHTGPCGEGIYLLL